MLAENLAYFMELRGIPNQVTLAKKAGIAQRTVSNYLRPANRGDGGTSGKAPSAKLTELQKIADALQVQPFELIRPIKASEREFYAVLEASWRDLMAKARDAANRAETLRIAP